jgi:hypothetical protein
MHQSTLKTSTEVVTKFTSLEFSRPLRAFLLQSLKKCIDSNLLETEDWNFLHFVCWKLAYMQYQDGKLKMESESNIRKSI